MQAVLGSWKEIANYLGKGVRTVQRWERCSGLPIHRPSGSSKGVVLAFPAELDKWARRQDGVHHVSAHSTLQRNLALSAELSMQTYKLLESTRAIMKSTNNFIDLARRRRTSASDDSASALPRAQ